MSTSRSKSSDPLRPDDYDGNDGGSVDQGPTEPSPTEQSPTGQGPSDGGPNLPKLGFVGWARWAWRQLTSMRTALVLLLLLAIAAIPGSIVPQRTADPNGVTQYYTDNPDLAPVLDWFKLFDVYTSPWFSAIYILLFVSLIGCVIPRAKHHYQALRSLPPRTPARLARLADHERYVVPSADPQALAEEAVTLATEQLRKARYRVERYDSRGSFSVSAERGYLRETGNLVFHIALVGVLLSVGIGGGFAYTGQRVIVEGTTFVNSVGTDYSSFNPGRFVDVDKLDPFTMKLDDFAVSYQLPGTVASGQAGDFAAHMTVTTPGGEPYSDVVRVNHPMRVAGDNVYLLGNGYAPTITIRNAAGEVVYSESQPFLPQDTNMTSLGILKVPDGLPEQVGLVGFFYPTALKMDSGAFTSVYPDLTYPVVSLNVFSGDLGINSGAPVSVYQLDTSTMTQQTGGSTGVASIQLMPGQTAELPNGWGTITFENAASPESETGTDAPAVTPDAGTGAHELAGQYAGSVKRFASLQIHRDSAAPFVLVFALLAVAGLLTALFVPRRRLWVKATPERGGDGVVIEYAGLARGEDPALSRAVVELSARNREALGLPTDLADIADTAESGRPSRRPTPSDDTDERA